VRLIGEAIACVAELPCSPQCSHSRRSAQSAGNLVVWWDQGFYPLEDDAVREIIAAIEQDTGKRVDRIHRVAAAVGKVHGAGSGGGDGPRSIQQWQRLVDLFGGMIGQPAGTSAGQACGARRFVQLDGMEWRAARRPHLRQCA
jgi:hypothetical protein